MTETSGPLAVPRTAAWFFLPLGACILYLLILFCIQGYFYLKAPMAIAPAESMELLEQWRVYVGMPVYEDYQTGHATHIYGPLGPWSVGILFHIFGPHLLIGRLVSAFFGFGCVALTLIFSGAYRRLTPALLSLALGLFLNTRMDSYFWVNKTDIPSNFFCMASLLLFYLGYNRRSTGWYASGIFLLICGFLFKQSAPAFAVVPAIAIFFSPERSLKEKWLYIISPFLSLILVVYIIKLFFPQIYFYFVYQPSLLYELWPGAVVLELFKQLLQTPIFLILSGYRLWVWKYGDTPLSPAERWIWCGALVLLPASAVATARWGAGPNSFMPGYFAIATCCAASITLFFSRCNPGDWRPARQVALGGLLGLALVFSIYTRPTLLRYYFQGYVEIQARDFHNICEHIVPISGKVLCPEDPTIPLLAGGKPGRHLYAEIDITTDANVGNRVVPERVWKELRAAEYVVDIEGYLEDFISPVELQGRGFQRIYTVGRYALWQNARTSETPSK